MGRRRGPRGGGAALSEALGGGGGGVGEGGAQVVIADGGLAGGDLPLPLELQVAQHAELGAPGG